eukprot:1012177-Pleurochrysis_carterae.AAC.5
MPFLAVLLIILVGFAMGLSILLFKARRDRPDACNLAHATARKCINLRVQKAWSLQPCPTSTWRFSDCGSGRFCAAQNGEDFGSLHTALISTLNYGLYGEFTGNNFFDVSHANFRSVASALQAELRLTTILREACRVSQVLSNCYDEGDPTTCSLNYSALLLFTMMMVFVQARAAASTRPTGPLICARPSGTLRGI